MGLLGLHLSDSGKSENPAAAAVVIGNRPIETLPDRHRMLMLIADTLWKFCRDCGMFTDGVETAEWDYGSAEFDVRGPRMKTPRSYNGGGAWHQDCGDGIGQSRSDYIVVWASRFPTEFREIGTHRQYRFKPFDVVIASNRRTMTDTR